MKNRSIRILLVALLLMLLLSACRLLGSGDEPAAPQPLPTLPSLDAAPTVVPANYPAPEAVAPATPTLDPDYPAPPTLQPTVDPYPGGLVWVIRPVGIQCEDGTTSGYGDLREATSTLTAAGVKVAGSEMAEMMVTTSCGSPTSAHFRLQIAAEDLQTALSLGWTQG